MLMCPEVSNAMADDRPGGRPGGDLAAQLVRLMPRLRRFASRLAGSGPEAEDLVQSACERALANVHRFEPGVPVDSWMYRTIQNLFVDGRRAAVVRGGNADPVDPDMLSGGNAADEAEANVMLAAVRRVVAELPDEQREILMLVCVEGMSYREAAETLDVPIGTVMSRLSRARAAVHDRLNRKSRLRAGRIAPL